MKTFVLALLACFLSAFSVILPVAAQGEDSSSAAVNGAESKRVDITLFAKGAFPNEALSGGKTGNWEEISFKGKTSYQVVSDDDKGLVLLGVSNGTASAIGKSIRVNLLETPYLNWIWKIGNRLDGIDETSRGGDDFAARIYVVKRAGIFGRNSKAVNYVWSSNQAKGSVWSNAFKPDNSKMIAVRGVDDKVDQWVVERHHVARDFRRLFGSETQTVDTLVIMTDTDNTGLSASARYGAIFFSD